MKYKIDIAPLEDYFVVVVKDNNTDELKETFTLNESGADMLRLLCHGKDVKTITQEMAKMYEAPFELVYNDVSAFVDKLIKKGLI